MKNELVAYELKLTALSTLVQYLFSLQFACMDAKDAERLGQQIIEQCGRINLDKLDGPADIDAINSLGSILKDDIERLIRSALAEVVRSNR